MDRVVYVYVWGESAAGRLKILESREEINRKNTLIFDLMKYAGKTIIGTLYLSIIIYKK